MTASDMETALRAFSATSAENIVAVYPFGSQARGTATTASDMDVAVLYAVPPPASLEGLPLELEATLE